MNLTVAIWLIKKIKLFLMSSCFSSLLYTIIENSLATWLSVPSSGEPASFKKYKLYKLYLVCIDLDQFFFRKPILNE